ncbi:MAG: hypothetical protein ACI9EH_000246 [Planktomarina sp.]|jgi:hypothetical protein
MVDKDAHYLMNKGGVFYFTRHVPNDLQCHYARPRICTMPSLTNT